METIYPYLGEAEMSLTQNQNNPVLEQGSIPGRNSVLAVAENETSETNKTQLRI